MKKYLYILIVLLSFSAQAQIYYLGQGGYIKVTQEGARENGVYPSGLSYGGGIGFRKNYFEFESLILKASGEDDLLHDGVKNKFKHDQTSLLLGLNFYLNKYLYARMGYGMHKIHQKLATAVSPASEAGAIKEYNLKDNKLSEGLYFGAGLNIYSGRSVSLFTQADKYDYANMKSGAWNFALGFRYYTN